MARRKANTSPTDTPADETTTPAAASAETTDAGATATRPIRRRRRRNVAPNDTPTVVEALLRTRGPQGASQDELEQVVGWARGVRSEAQALTDAMKRPTRQKQEKFGDRVTQHEMNLVLLNGILNGSVGLDVKDGRIVFLHGSSSASGSGTSAVAGAGSLDGAGEPVAAGASA